MARFASFLVSFAAHVAVAAVLALGAGPQGPGLPRQTAIDVSEVRLGAPLAEEPPRFEGEPASRRLEVSVEEGEVVLRPDPVPLEETLASEDAPRSRARVIPRPVPRTDRVPVPPAPVDADEATTRPERSSDNPPPPYPELARRMGYEGRVGLRIRVSAEGRPAQVEVAESSRHEILDAAAVEAVRQWRFTPARRAGRAVEGEIDVAIRFRLTD